MSTTIGSKRVRRNTTCSYCQHHVWRDEDRHFCLILGCSCGPWEGATVEEADRIRKPPPIIDPAYVAWTKAMDALLATNYEEWCLAARGISKVLRFPN
jgi:hypothetical protein